MANINHNKIIVGMSGGVDSSVAAYLLLEQGYAVEGLFMKNWEEDDTGEYCTAAVDLEDAQQVCDRLGIRLHTVNFSAEYWDRVFEHFLAEYRAGRTPNPDVLCNREIKFRAFLDHAISLGAEAIATGHYVRGGISDPQHRLLKAVDDNKDQSYFLYMLSHEQLSHAMFPLGNIAKPRVREIAEQQGFANSRKKDSTGICFIGERNFRDFLERYLPAQPGDICTTDGKIIGRHHGLMYYTIGQRQGLGIGGLRDADEQPWFVAEKDLDNNRLLVVQGGEHPLLYKQGLLAIDLHWTQTEPPTLPMQCMAKTRYRQPDQACTVTRHKHGLRVLFAEPQRAITPGQSIVFYAGDICLGGAIITEGFNLQDNNIL
ncbi:tRNA 2-thiouridine(34) synthase MnmA [Sulfuriflexus sp.]|uniref:tRNA 2-thiouridine(34) synthase MnmA n=1 Tax=Sulfuriflexus sp. TaxID=2015443 RepID=UPI0028CEF50F|nr:tRNA 2-thiouridine(34) synthase MnmA [Sulfuriflexus sp.]MDT8404949.1 tRNA 2-thiouridine(34) synthase MnmA [Sulfuriflexus sp.]